MTTLQKIVVVIVLFVGSASAADFRALDVGESCATVRDTEVAAGSTPTSWSGIAPHVYAFTGQEFGREIEISYFCPHGTLVTGNYFIPERSLNDALRSYGEVHAKLSSKLGEPTLDNSPWQKATQKKRLPIPSDQSKYYFAWFGQRMDTVLSFLMSSDRTNAKWTAAIVVMPNKETREATAKFPR